MCSWDHFDIQGTGSHLQKLLCIWLAYPFIFKIRCCAAACHRPNYPWWMLDKFLTRTNNCVDHCLRVCCFPFPPRPQTLPSIMSGDAFDKINLVTCWWIIQFWLSDVWRRNCKRETRLALLAKALPPTDRTSSQTNYHPHPSSSWAPYREQEEKGTLTLV